MAKRPPSRAQLWLALVVGLGLLSWMWWTFFQARAEYDETKERYDRVSERIESYMPQGEEIQPTRQFVDSRPRVTVVLERTEKEGADDPWIWIRVGNTAWDLPGAPEGGSEAAWAAWDATAQPVFADVLAAIEAAAAAHGGDADRIVGRIQAARGEQGDVSHGLVVRVLDLFVTAGIEDVSFDGAPAPRPEGLVVEADER